MADFTLLGARLLGARRRLKQKELAQHTVIHPVTLSRIEHGNFPTVSLELIARLAGTLGVSVDYLLLGLKVEEEVSTGEQTDDR